MIRFALFIILVVVAYGLMAFTNHPYISFGIFSLALFFLGWFMSSYEEKQQNLYKKSS